MLCASPRVGLACAFAFILSFHVPRALAAPTFAAGVSQGTVSFPELSEASGVVSSRNNPNVLWTHNDSGDSARIFAIDTQGHKLGIYNLPGAVNVDYEDIGMGPGPVSNIMYLYVGDIGDNTPNRANIKVYQIPEPAVYQFQSTNPLTLSMKGVKTITLNYPDGPFNAESLFVDPWTGDLFIPTKQSGTSRIYTATKAQLDTQTSIVLTFVRAITFDVASGADISPTGKEIVVRRESHAELWKRAEGQSVSNALGTTSVTIPVIGTPTEPNGEAIGFDYLGSGYYTLSDNSTSQPLYYFARTSNDGPPPAPRLLLGPAATWKYLDNGSDQGTAWHNPSFNDSSWSTGVAQFGYGDGDEQTVVSYGPNSNNKYVTTYFRKNFVANNVTDVTNLTLKLVVDDGAVAWLNGKPVAHENLGTNAAYNALATAMPVALQSTWHAYQVDPRVLTEGTNTIAVEIHQSSVTSSNISFDAQLVAAGAGAVYEPFNYSPGTTLTSLTNAGGQWWTTAGTGSGIATVVTGGLAVNGLAPSYGVAMQFGAVDGPSARFNLIGNVTNSTLFYSFALKVTDLGALSPTGSYIAGFNNTRGSQTGTPTVLGNRILARTLGNGMFNLGVAKNSTNIVDWVWATNALTVGETVFLVGSYTFNSTTTSDDVAMLWINPSPYDFSAAQAPTATLVADSGPDITANQIASFVFLQRGSGNTDQPGNAVVDELRIAPTWASVTPLGTIQPVLQISKTATKVILSWPTNSVGFTLEAAAALTPPNLWTNVTAPVATLGGDFVVTNDILNTPTFYRIRQ